MPDNTTAAELADWHAQQAEQRRQALGWQGEDKVTGPALRKLHADIEFHAQACDSIRALIAPNGVIAWAHPYGRVVPASTMESAKRDGGAMESSLAGYTIPCVAALLRASEGRAPDGAAGVVEKALRRSFSLGQTYWQQADSDFVSQHKKSDYTQQRFEALCAETVAMLTAAPHPPAQQAVDTVEVVGIKNGKEHALGTMPMPPMMKARELVREQFGHFQEEDGSEADMAMYVCEALVKHMVAAGWRLASPPPHKAEGAEPQKGGV